MSWASDIPSELLCQPMGVVILTGLNITHNPVHKAVCDAFSVNRHADRVSVCFMSFGLDHIYPKPKLEVSFFTRNLLFTTMAITTIFDLSVICCL